MLAWSRSRLVCGGAVAVLRCYRENMITLTSSAADKVSELIASESDDGLALRVAVRPGGCSGFSYEMYFDTDFAEDDCKATFGSVDVVVDPSSAMLLEGATLDYANGLAAGRFLHRQSQRPAYLRLRTELQLAVSGRLQLADGANQLAAETDLAVCRSLAVDRSACGSPVDDGFW